MTQEKPSVKINFLVQWQSLVVAVYRSLWRELAKEPDWSVTMIAPDRFREGGMQELPCAPADPRDPPLWVLPVKRWHTQAVWFKGLTGSLRRWLQDKNSTRVYLCFTEPYALTALFSIAGLFAARVFSAFQGPRPLFLLYGFQNIYKRFPLPLRLLQQMMFRCCDGIFVAGGEHERVLRQHGYRGPCVRFPMWFDPAVFFPPDGNAGSSVKFPRDTQKIVIGYAGSLLPEKGIAQMLDQFIKDPGPLADCSLRIAGGGVLRDEIQGQIETLKGRGLDARFLGPVPFNEMADFYRSIDILVVPSRTAPHWKEQFGRVIIEAMACGSVVIGSDSGEIPVVIDDPTRIFPENDMIALGQVLTRAVKAIRDNGNGERARSGETAMNRYSDRVVASQLARDVRGLIDRADQGGARHNG